MPKKRLGVAPLEKKEKETIVTFNGRELLGDMTYMDIERLCGQELQYRTIYSFFQLNEGKAKVDTAARIALAMGTSLDALYSPKGASWATTSAAPAIAEEKNANSDVRIIFSHLTKDALSKLALELMGNGHDALGELCNQHALGLVADNSAESEDAQDG